MATPMGPIPPSACEPACPGLMTRFSDRFADEPCMPVDPGCPQMPTLCGDEVAMGPRGGPIVAYTPPLANPFDDKTKHQKRTVLAQFNFSLADAEANPTLATYSLSPQQIAAFKSGDGDLAQIVFLGLKVCSVRSTAAVTLAVQLPGVAGSQPLPNGKMAVFSIMPGELRALDRQVYAAGPELVEAKFEYVKTTEAELRRTLMVAPDEDYTCAALKHPVSRAVINNAAELKIPAQDFRLYDGRLKISNDLVEMCVGAMMKAKEAAPVTDLSKYTISLMRADGENFGSPKNVAVLAPNSVVEEALLNETRSVECEFEFTYMFV